MLNGRLSNDLAAAFAHPPRAESRRRPRARRRAGLPAGRWAGRRRRAERALSLAFLREQTLKEFALAVFNLNGFLYVP